MMYIYIYIYLSWPCTWCVNLLRVLANLFPVHFIWYYFFLAVFLIFFKTALVHKHSTVYRFDGSIFLLITICVCVFFLHSRIDNVNAVPAVSVAAKKLSILLQQNGNMAYQPDPFTANILNKWLETHLPVSFFSKQFTFARHSLPPRWRALRAFFHFDRLNSVSILLRVSFFHLTNKG